MATYKNQIAAGKKLSILNKKINNELGEIIKDLPDAELICIIKKRKIKLMLIDEIIET